MLGLGSLLVALVGAAAEPAEPPEVTGVNPTHVVAFEATPIVIDGTGFQVGANVTINGFECSSIVVNSPTEIACSTPPLGEGTFDIVVTNPDDQNSGTSGNGLITFGVVPVVVGIAPTSGSESGGDHVVIEVEDSTGATAAHVGGNAVTGFAIDDATHVSGDTQAHAPGDVDVTVTNAFGTSAPLEDGYEFEEDVAAPAAPLGITPDLGDPGGGVHVVIEVADSAGLIAADIDGVALQNFAIDDGTHVSGDTDTLTPGTHDVRVQNAAGWSDPLENAFEAWSPAVEDFNLLLLPGDYGVDMGTGTWEGTASAGSSGSNDVAEASTPPTDASGIPDFDGSDDVLAGSASTDYFTLGAGTAIVLFRADTAAASAGAGSRVDDEGLLAQNGGGVAWSITYSSDGVCALVYDGGYKELIATAATGAWHLVQVKWDSSNLKLRVNGGAWDSVACGAIDGSGDLVIGKNYASAQYDGKMRLVAIADAALADSIGVKLYTWAQGKGLLT